MGSAIGLLPGILIFQGLRSNWGCSACGAYRWPKKAGIPIKGEHQMQCRHYFVFLHSGQCSYLLYALG